MRKNSIFMSIWAGIILFSVPAMAGSLDGSNPLICATIEAFECSPGDACQGGTVQGVNLPQFLRIDFKKKTISGVREDGSVLTTPIRNTQQVDGKLILDGIQNDVGWTLIVSETTGKMTISATKDQVGFVVFGACTTP